jgi:hypothetical protein
MDDDDDTQVYKDHGDALTIAYQSGYYDGKKAAQRPWVGLTDEEIADYLGDEYHVMTESELRFFRLGEVAAKEKNT